MFFRSNDRILLQAILLETAKMALQLDGLTAAQAKVADDVTALTTAVQSLIAMHTDPAQQAAVDAVAAALGTVATSVEALTSAVNAVVTPPAPAG